MPEIRSLSCPLSDEDYKLRAHKLASALQKKMEVEAHKKAVAERYNSEIKSLDEEVGDLTAVVKNKCEFRPVECVWKEDHKTSMMRLIRIDTGTEIDSRAMTAAEKQVKLFPVGGKKDDKKAAAGKGGKKDGNGSSPEPTAA